MAKGIHQSLETNLMWSWSPTNALRPINIGYHRIHGYRQDCGIRASRTDIRCRANRAAAAILVPSTYDLILSNSRLTLDCPVMGDSESTAPEVTELAEGLHRALSKLISILRRGDPHGAAAGDLTLAQLSILVTLLDQGPIRMTDLAAHERVRTPTTTVAIRRLEKIGLVKRLRDPSDLRAVLVDITPQGRAVHGESLANRRAALAAILSQLPSSDLGTLTQALAPLERLAFAETDQRP